MMKQTFFEKNSVQVSLLLILVFSVFSVAFQSDFLPWDDDIYVTENAAIKKISSENIKKIFTTAYAGNYQPVTMLSYMADYFFGGEKPFCYHFTNVVFHFLNSVLLLFLLRKLLNDKLIAFAGAMIFAIHPMQSETVMWIAERKNVLYVFFFLLASLGYLRFLDGKKIKYYVIALLFFTLSLLSKATAVAFPLCMICYDLMYRKNISLRSLLPKLPFFFLAGVVGFVTLSFQEEAGYINEEHNFNFFTKIIFAGYAYCIYIFKFFIPVSLSSYYPYPGKIELLHVLASITAVVILSGIFILIRKKKYVEAGGLLFFTSNILFVLQFIPFGEVLVAERYNYLSSVGLIITAGAALSALSNKLQSRKIIPVTVTAIIIAFGILCCFRNLTWKDSIVFYNDILKKFPDSYIITNSLGAEYMKKNNFTAAQEWFDKAKKLNPDYYSVYYNEALSFLKQNKVEEAYASLSKSIQLKPYYKALFARATILEQNGQFKPAIDDLDKVLELNPDNAKAYHLRAVCKEKSGRFDEAIADYDRAIALQPDAALFYLGKGITLGKMGKIQETLSEFDTAIQLKPDYAQAFYARAISKQRLGQNPCEDLKEASQLGYETATEAALKFCR